MNRENERSRIEESESPGEPVILDVWEENFITEIRTISNLIEEYNYISMVSTNSYLNFTLFLHFCSSSNLHFI
jgi:hypothetical protein